MQARSYVRPDGRITGSDMGAPSIGHRNSGGTSSSLSTGDRVAGTDGCGGGGFEWKGRSFQRRARAAPMLNYQLGSGKQSSVALVLLVQ